MEVKEHLLGNGNTVYYLVCNRTYYEYAIKLKDGTYEERDKADMTAVINACEYARNSNERIRLWYGDVSTGCAWDDEYDVTGYINSTGGYYSIPILLSNNRSRYGMAILTNRIIRLDSTKTGKTLYKHPKFYVEPMEIRKEENPEMLERGLTASVYQKYLTFDSPVCIARFETRKKAENWIKFMTGERYSK